MKRFVTHLSLVAAGAMVATGCVPTRHNLPPAQQMMEPGPGVGGPGPGVLAPTPYAMGAAAGPAACSMAQGGMPMGGPAQAAGPDGNIAQVAFNSSCNSCNSGGIPAGGGIVTGMPMMAPMMQPVQVTFGRPEGMQIRYDQSGGGMFDSEPLIAPARQNFPQGGLFRIKLTNIPGREGVELYPTIELAFSNPRTGAYLAHNSIPIQFDEEDFDQVVTGNFVTKVLYLPDPDFQGPALAGIDTLVSTRLDPGVDPIVEADRRGSILAIVRLGDKDIEMAGAGGIGMGMAPPIAGLPAPFAPASTDGCGPNGGVCSSTPPQLPGMISGVTAPQYGMPISGTPIGLPGPPHIPLGVPAGLQKHVMRNRTPMHLPQPVDKVKMTVRQQPGFSYPNPVSRVRVTEQNIHPGVPNQLGLLQGASQSVGADCQP
ncbi:hypothetical protein LOC67_25530 [Stieleria sp. JC731]|uniref:hypothetical protein n=1 Tax=Pirellulaceae TaxID=2691357 RepID=UPI001E4FECB3|nr:hypothetical protein [Stieleria sp. JC731]MCC9603928.1 hypothetical protein [Stieleria sp. JC731]